MGHHCHCDKKCEDLPQPPTTTAIPLEGQNCSCCKTEKCKVLKRNANSNYVCLNYDQLCDSLNTPIVSPPIVNPAALQIVPNPPLNIPACQTIDIPPEVPVEDRLSLTGKNVLVIGGSRGNGKGIAERLAAEGAHVIATSRWPECYQAPSGYLLWKVDVTSECSVKKFVEKAVAHFSNKIDILVNCPKSFFHGPMADANGKEFLNGLEQDLVGYHRVTHYVLPHMRHSNESRVVSIGSITGYLAVSGVYGVSKRGLQQWNAIMQAEEMVKRATTPGLKGPTFVLIEPYFIQTVLGLYEFFKPGSLSDKDNQVLISKSFQAAQLPGSPVSIPASELAAQVFNILVAPQPGVRYLIASPDAKAPDGVTPLTTFLQFGNALSATEQVNQIGIPFTVPPPQAAIDAQQAALVASYCQ